MAALKTQMDTLHLQDKVILAGPFLDTAPFYAASDCYLLTSTTIEGFSLTTAEALASGLPVIAPNDDVFSSVYGAASAVQRCNATDSNEWSKALLSLALLDPSARQSLSQEARSFAEKNLATEVMNKNLTLFYENIFAKLRENHFSVNNQENPQ